MIYSIKGLKKFGIGAKLVYRHIAYLEDEGWAHRDGPYSAWMIDSMAIPYLTARIGRRGRPRMAWANAQAALQVWEKTGVITRVADALGSDPRTAKRFLERRGVIGQESVQENSGDVVDPEAV